MKQRVICYDDGGRTIDRYTAVFQYPCDGEYQYLTMNERPFHPQGFGQHGSNEARYGRPNSETCGKRIKRSDLPADCQEFIRQELQAYASL